MSTEEHESRVLQAEGQEKKKAFVLPLRVLRVLGGSLREVEFPSGRKLTLAEGGGYLWGVEHLGFEKIGGVFDHSCRVGRGAEVLVRAIKERSRGLRDGKFEEADPSIAAEGGVIHDIAKIPFGASFVPKEGFWIAGVENLTAEEKTSLGLPGHIREISPETDSEVVKWLRREGFSEEVIRTVVGHDFPTSEEAAETLYQRATMWADYCCGNSFTGTYDRLRDVFDRWINPYVSNIDQFGEIDSVQLVVGHSEQLKFEDKTPRIEPERAAMAANIILGNNSWLFSYLGVTEADFITREGLNDDARMPPWERVLRQAWNKDYVHQKEGGVGAPRASHVKTILEKKFRGRE